jgi:membrane-associated phospholipid phosphatase
VTAAARDGEHGTSGKIPLASWIDDWGRWLLRGYFFGSLACLVVLTALTFFVDVPGPRTFAVLLPALYAPLVWILVSLLLRLRKLRRGELVPTPVDAPTRPGWLGQLSQLRWLIATVAMFALWPGTYFVVAQLSGWREPVQFHFAVDQRIPMRTEFALIYVGIYWFFITPLLFGQGREFFWPTLKGYASVLLICGAFFTLYPVSYPRDPLVVRHFGDWALEVVRRADPPINCFPSSHCAVAVFAALGLLRFRPQAFLPGAFVALGICAATVFTRQHYLIDTLAGMLLGACIYLWFLRPELRAKLRASLAARIPTRPRPG